VTQTLLSATLDNGITLLGERLPGVESVAVAFHAPAGAVHDPAGGCGLATLAGEMCLRGAGDRDSRQFVEALEGAGVTWSQAVSTSHASFSGAMVARQLPEVLPVYADLLRRPRLPAEEFPAARQLVMQNLAALDDDPAHRALAELRRLHCPHPWGMPTEGIAAEIEALELDDVRRFLAKHLQPRGLIVAVAGRVEWDDFVDRVRRLLGDWPPQPEPPVTPGPRGPHVRHLPHDAQQTHVGLAWSVPPYRSDESYEASAALAILGGGASSRLFTEVRERRGLCYGVSAGYQSLRDVGLAVCHAGSTAARAQETLDVILAEIGRLPGTIEAAEVERVKARATAALVMQQESSAARAGAIARQWYHLGTVRPLAAELARYDALSVRGIEDWLARQPARDLTVVSLGRAPLEVPGAIPA